MKVAMTLLNCSKPIAFKILEFDEAMVFIKESLEDGLVVSSTEWKEDYTPIQWDDRAFDYRV